MDAQLQEDIYIEGIIFQNYMEDIFLGIIVLVKVWSFKFSESENVHRFPRSHGRIIK